jgi:hypothetical protein
MIRGAEGTDLQRFTGYRRSLDAGISLSYIPSIQESRVRIDWSPYDAKRQVWHSTIPTTAQVEPTGPVEAPGSARDT